MAIFILPRTCLIPHSATNWWTMFKTLGELKLGDSWLAVSVSPVDLVTFQEENSNKIPLFPHFKKGNKYLATWMKKYSGVNIQHLSSKDHIFRLGWGIAQPKLLLRWINCSSCQTGFFWPWSQWENCASCNSDSCNGGSPFAWKFKFLCLMLGLPML